MEPISGAKIANILRGNLIGAEDTIMQRVVIDSRQVECGDLFVAIIGKNKDGHDFLDEAWRRGASGALISKKVIPPDGRSAILVDDTLQGLQDLGRFNRNSCDPIVVCITGSNGKTTTKDLTASVMEQKFSILKTKGNLNNEYGLPLTLLGLLPRHEMAVVEIGMNKLGEIALLSEIARPNIGILTNIGPTHLEFLGDLAGVAKGKSELIDTLPADGLLIYNGDDDYLQKICKPFRGKKLTFGFGDNNDLVGQEVKRAGEFHSAFGVRIKGDYHLFRLPLLGKHNVYNALAAIALGWYYELSVAQISKGLLEAEISAMRMEIKTFSHGYTIINDVYNANPVSMQHALETLKDIAFNRKIAILGDMLELGKETDNFHLQVGHWVAELGVDRLFTVGDLGRIISRGALEAGMPQYKIANHRNNEKLLAALKQVVQPTDTILIKGSRAMKLEEIVEGLE